MFSISSQVIDQIFLPSFLRFLLIGGGCSLIIGIGLILRSEQMFRIFEKMNRWISCRHIASVLEIPRDCWPVVVRYRYVLSAFITLGAAYAVTGLLTQMDMWIELPRISSVLHLPNVFVSWMLISIKWFLVGGCVISMVVGLMLGFSLTTLSKIEVLSGRWISTRYSKADVLHTGLDKLVVSFPRTAGWIVTVLSMVELTLVGMQVYW